MANPTITIRISEEEKKFIAAYAAINGVSLSDFMRETALERIEDELDLKAWDIAKAEHDADPITYTADEVEKMFL